MATDKIFNDQRFYSQLVIFDRNYEVSPRFRSPQRFICDHHDRSL